jgi:inosine/xanthosine triphosphatase
MIAVGSTNKIKVQAVEEAAQDYPVLAGLPVQAVAVPSGVADQPMSLEEIITGAKNRAKNAFHLYPECRYSFGIESGLFQVNSVETGFLEASFCCIYDGKNNYVGMSCGFEVPKQILNFVLEKKMDLSQACLHSGITANTHLGSAEGLIGLLTKGRVNRKEYTRQAIVTAMMQVEHAHWYQSCSNQ